VGCGRRCEVLAEGVPRSHTQQGGQFNHLSSLAQPSPARLHSALATACGSHVSADMLHGCGITHKCANQPTNLPTHLGSTKCTRLNGSRHLRTKITARVHDWCSEIHTSRQRCTVTLRYSRAQGVLHCIRCLGMCKTKQNQRVIQGW
jgi:hypothetical protein